MSKQLARFLRALLLILFCVQYDCTILELLRVDGESWQLGASHPRCEAHSDVFARQSIRKTLGKGLAKIEFCKELEWVVKLMEDALVFAYWLAKSKSRADSTMAITTFVKCRTDTSLTQQVLKGKLTKYLLETDLFEPQSGFDTVIDASEALLFNYTALKHSPLVKKLQRFSTYCVALQIYDKMGIKLHHDHYSKIEREVLKRKFTFGPDFVHCLLDTTVFLLKQGRQCAITGSIDPLFHSGSNYVKWMSDSRTLLTYADQIGDIECKYDYHTYLGALDDALETGKTILKRTGITSRDRIEHDLIAGLLRSLDAKIREILSRKAAMEMRAQPLGLFVYGTPGIGKTTVMDILFKYYAVLHKSNPEEAMKDHYKFTKNAFAKYWDNFTSNMWCLVLDDVVAAHPKAVQGVDESIKELIAVINNQPYVPDQAALEKKGKTPFKGELVLVSSNVGDLWMSAYMSKTYAPLRRVPYRIEPIVREEFRVPGGMKLDSSKVALCEPSPGAYADFWRFKVSAVVPEDKDHMQGRYANKLDREGSYFEFEDMKSLLEWYAKMSTQHVNDQKIMLDAAAKTTAVQICACGGKHPLAWCTEAEVLRPQAGRLLTRRGGFTTFDRGSGSDTVTDSSSDEDVEVRSSTWGDYATPMRQTPVKRRDPYDLTDRENIEEYMDLIDANADHKQRSILDTLFGWSIHLGLYLYLEWFVFKWATHWCMTFPVTRAFVHRHIMPRLVRPAVQEYIMDVLGERVHKSFKGWRFTDVVLSVVLTAAGAALVVKAIRFFLGADKAPDKERDEKPLVKPESGRTKGAPCRAPKTGKESFWQHDVVEMTPFDMTRTQASMKSMSDEDLQNYVGNNCVHFVGRGVTSDGPTMCEGNALALRGNVWITNFHTIAGFKSLNIDFQSAPQQSGLSSNFKESFSESDFHLMEGTDIAWFQTTSTRPRKDITGMVAQPSFRGRFEGFYVQRDQKGVVARDPVRCLHMGEVRIAALDHLGDVHTVWKGIPEIDTDYGDCGSPLIGVTPTGPVILGIHMVGNTTVCGAQPLTSQMVETILTRAGVVVASGYLKTQHAGFGSKLIPTGQRSALNYAQPGCVQNYGQLDEYNVGGKSRVAKTYICDTLLAASSDYSIKHGPPEMKHWQPWMLALNQMTDRSVSLDKAILGECVDGYVTDVLTGLPKGAMEHMGVLDLGTALNGAPGVSYIDSINRSTSAGYPYNKSKKFFLTDSETEQWPDGVDITLEIETQVDECLRAYEKGERFHPIFKGTLKDEALPFKKIAAKKTRVFTGGPFAWSLVVRMYFLSFVKLMTEHRIVFEAAVGTNTHSREWEQLRAYLAKFGTDKLVAGDYRSFDKGMPASVMWAAFGVITRVCQAARREDGTSCFSEEDIRVMTCVAADTTYPTVNFHGELLEFNGTNPSGHPLTVIINCIANSLYMRYAFKKTGYEVPKFKQSVALLTYGDDNAMSVSDECPNFHHTSIMEAMQEIGIGYTMADKDAESVPYITIADVSFLKRTWRWDVDLEAYVAPLEHDSINKMLTMGVVSKTNSPEATAASVISSAMSEYFFYGKDIFNEKRELLLAVAMESGVWRYLTQSMVPSWEELRTRFERASQGVCIYPSLESVKHDDCTNVVTA